LTGITMYDTAFNGQFPPGAEAYAAYVDGGVGSQPNYPWIVETFPGAQHLSIALFPGDDADALDVEPGAAPPESAVAWYAAQRARGVARPCFYASADTMEEFAVPVIEAALIPRDSVRLWSAHYDAGEHVCGPSSCKAMSVEADGTQWTPNAVIDGKARDLDQSLLAAGFFAVPSPPRPPGWTYGPPREPRAAGGHTSVSLTWEPPADAPEPPARYHVYVYAGSECSRATLVKSYPRGTAAISWEGGSLQRGKPYTAHVVAAGPGATHVKPFVFASASFSTG
jgi:hypothetical protein